jgi:anti-sigma28 factor (negative regulator of flagellin synthesis)
MGAMSREQVDNMDKRPSDPRLSGQASTSTTEDRLRTTRKVRLEVIRSVVDSGMYEIPAIEIAESILDRATSGLLPREE